MPTAPAYSVGWIDSSIGHFLDALGAPPPRSMKYALVTSLDSTTEVRTLLSASLALAPLSPSAQVVGDGILISTARLLAAHRSRPIFVGFDEVWFFPHAIKAAKPSEHWIVGPAPLVGELPGNLVDWMQENHCTLGLGDGAGLNFAAKLQGLAKLLLEESLEAGSSHR